jgi:NitT/TauT family transport system permease protein
MSDSNYRNSIKFRYMKWLWLAAMIPLWEVLRRLFDVNPLLMPPISAILTDFLQGLFGGQLLVRWLRSLLVVSGGLGAGVLMALIVLLFSRAGFAAASLCSMLSTVMHPLPGLALLPLVILWMGTGTAAVIFIIIHSVLWPVFVSLDSGFRSQPPAWNIYARILNLKPGAAFLRVSLPGSFPHLISGIRIAWARAWRAFIAAEMVFGAVGNSGGLGWHLFKSRVMMDTPATYSTLLAVIITGLLMEEVLLSRWEESVRRKWGENQG